MNPAKLLATLVARGVEFRAFGDKIRFRPAERLSDEEMEALRRNKPALLKLLRSNSAPLVRPGSDDRRNEEPAETPTESPRSPPTNQMRLERLWQCLTTCDRCDSPEFTDVPIQDNGFQVFIDRAFVLQDTLAIARARAGAESTMAVSTANFGGSSAVPLTATTDVVPEPASVMMLTAAIFSILVFARRRQNT